MTVAQMANYLLLEYLALPTKRLHNYDVAEGQLIHSRVYNDLPDIHKLQYSATQ